LAEEYRTKLDAITSYDETIRDLQKKKEAFYAKLLSVAATLTNLRQDAAKEIERQMQAYLIPLGMPNVRFAVELTSKKEPDSKGMDHVTFLFSANKNGVLQNVASIASGGEIARVMLSLKAMIAGAVKLPTIIFDEIDTGVSGSIAEKMALIMEEMGQADRQVISITHLPQIAARGKNHYKVYKEDTEVGTNSHIRPLNEEERINEIANMLSGATLTEAALNNAKALLNNQPL
jgi:DNA repair protein RecN (Recombination protein N)